MRELSLFQKVSVLSSAATIAFGVSRLGVQDRSVYLSRSHSKTTSFLVLALFAFSEVAFCGGICRFSFALKVGDIQLLPYLIPFVALSSVLAMAPIVCDWFLFPRGEFIFLTSKLFIWFSIVGIFFFQWPFELGKRIGHLKMNNSLATFMITMMVTSVINFTLGFFLHKRKANFKMYHFVDSMLGKIADVMTVQSAFALDDITHCKYTSRNNEQKPTTDSDLREQEPSKQTQNINDSKKKWQRKKALKRWRSEEILVRAMLGVFLILLLSTIIALFTYITFKKDFYPNERNYSVEFFYDCQKGKYMTAGFPVVSEPKNSHKGSICVDDKTPQQMYEIAKVIVKQLQAQPVYNKSNISPLLLVGSLSYDGNYDEESVGSLESPFLQPTCTGEERNLIYCMHGGLNVGLTTKCLEGKSRLYISIISNPTDFPNVAYFFMIEPNNFNASEKICLEETKSKKNHFSRIVCAQEGYALLKHLPKMKGIKGIWLDQGRYLDISKEERKIILRQDAGKEILPSICMVSFGGKIYISIIK